MHTDDSVTVEFRRLFDRELSVSEDSWLVLEGDWGGQIYLSVPWKLVGELPEIGRLLTELDRIAWPGNGEGDDSGASASLYDPVSYQLTADDGVAGGMGGGLLTDDLWLHEEFGEAIRDRARELLRLKA